MKIVLTNQKSYQAIAVLENISKFTGMAIQGKKELKYVAGQNVTATSKLGEGRLDYTGNPTLDFDNCTVEISSDFFSELSLNRLIETGELN